MIKGFVVVRLLYWLDQVEDFAAVPWAGMGLCGWIYPVKILFIQVGYTQLFLEPQLPI